MKELHPNTFFLTRNSMIQKIAISQKPPVLTDLKATMALALEIVEEAAKEGAKLVVLPEAFFPGYPLWVWRLRPGSDGALAGQLHARLRENAIDITAGDLDPLLTTAAKHKVFIVAGMNERDGEFSRSTLYNTVVLIGADGTILNRHRKLIPTNPERTVWGRGDASGLRTVETPFGRIGVLPCWETYMPLARYALYAEGMDIFISPTWDHGEVWNASMRHIAKEGGCYVVSTATALQASDIPDDLPGKSELYPDKDEWLCSGDAVVIEPGGQILAGPLHNEKGILYAEIDSEKPAAARRSLDVCGHYARPDIFKLTVNREEMPPIEYTTEPLSE